MTGTVNCYMSEEVLAALEVESEDILIVWVLTEDDQWQLCVQCDTCECWLMYPWVDHPCEDLESLKAEVEVANVQAVIQTSMDELTEGIP